MIEYKAVSVLVGSDAWWRGITFGHESEKVAAGGGRDVCEEGS